MMCGIFASQSDKTFNELRVLNKHRGVINHSFVIRPLDIHQEKGLFDYTISSESYKIGHVQSPTTVSDTIQPVQYDNWFLYHNGIIKSKELTNEHDSQYLLRNIIDNGFSFLSSVDGSFACILFNEDEIFVFRNTTAPLFYTDSGSFSSVPFDNCQELDAGIVFKLTNKLEEIGTFDITSSTYFIL